MSLFDFKNAKDMLSKTIALGGLVLSMFGVATPQAKASTLPVQKLDAKTIAYTMKSLDKTETLADMAHDSTYHVSVSDSVNRPATMEIAPVEVKAPAKLAVAKTGYTNKIYDDNGTKKHMQKLLKRREGYVQHIYADCRGLPTTGVGHYLYTLQDATSRPFFVKDMKTGKLTDKRASKKQITEAYQTITKMSHGPGVTADGAKGKTNVYLKSDYVEKMLKNDIDYVTAVVKHNLPFYDKMPEPAKEAVLTMAYAVGPNRLKSHYYTHNSHGKLVDRGFPRLVHALEKGDLETAARLSPLRGVSDHFNKQNQKQFREGAAELHRDRLEVAIAQQPVPIQPLRPRAAHLNGFTASSATFGPSAFSSPTSTLRL